MGKPTVSIIGFGRFGQLWARVLKNHADIRVYDQGNKLSIAEKFGIRLANLEEACASEHVFYAVPISQLESVVEKTKRYFASGQTVLDVCSVKAHSRRVFEKHLLNSGANLILTHPMFGPDSARSGLNGLPIMMCNLQSSEDAYEFWKRLFASLELDVQEMTPEEHDYQAAFSQGVTHTIGRVLDEMKLKHTSIDSKGFKALMEVAEQTCHDSWELFRDLQVFNPYTKEMRMKLEQAFATVNKALIPACEDQTIIIGIQGGKGSFNEEACKEHCARIGLKDYRIEYLYTSERVLTALENGDIDRGQCATQNSIGGVVRETIHALSEHRSSIVDEFEFIVNHALLARPGVTLDRVSTIMSHPQALAQCQSTLPAMFPDKKLVPGTGDFVDQANAAKSLSCGDLPDSTAVLASRVCANLYNLDILADNLQDRRDNYTSFIWLERV